MSILCKDTLDFAPYEAKKKILFVSCNGRKIIRVGRSVKIFFLHNLFGQKCVLCIFYVDWELGGQ